MRKTLLFTEILEGQDCIYLDSIHRKDWPGTSSSLLTVFSCFTLHINRNWKWVGFNLADNWLSPRIMTCQAPPISDFFRHICNHGNMPAMLQLSRLTSKALDNFTANKSFQEDNVSFLACHAIPCLPQVANLLTCRTCRF